MWQDLFRRQSTVSRLADGPWGPHFEEFVAGLARDHYSTETIRRSLCAADHFGRWLLAQDLALDDVDDRKIEQYRSTVGDAPRAHGRTAHAV